MVVECSYFVASVPGLPHCAHCNCAEAENISVPVQLKRAQRGRPGTEASYFVWKKAVLGVVVFLAVLIVMYIQHTCMLEYGT